MPADTEFDRQNEADFSAIAMSLDRDYRDPQLHCLQRRQRYELAEIGDIPFLGWAKQKGMALAERFAVTVRDSSAAPLYAYPIFHTEARQPITADFAGVYLRPTLSWRQLWEQRRSWSGDD